MLVIVGLGNPGKNYENTVHNLGFMAIDCFADEFGFKFSKTKYSARIAEGSLFGEKIVLVKPETFMNLSGKSVEEIVRMHKLKTEEILVISDDIDLPFGDIRIRQGGSAGTHNGLRDIVAKIGTDFPRIRLGVGRPENMDLASYVLSRLPQEKIDVLQEKFKKTSKIIELFIKNKSVNGIDVNKI